MANIKKYTTKNGEKRYYFRIYLGIDPQTGKKKQTTRRGFKTQKEAKIEISKLQLELEKNGHLKKENTITFQQVFDEFLESYKLTVRQNTYREFIREINYSILPFLKEKRIDKIKINDVQKIVNQLFKRRKRFHIAISKMKRIFTFAYQRGYIEKNPCDRVIIPKEKFQDEKNNFYTKTELEQFLSLPFFKQKKNLIKYAFFRLLSFSGIRKGEAAALKWSDINNLKRTIDINKTLSLDVKRRLVVNPPKTSSGIRKITLDQNTINTLNEWHNIQRIILLSKGLGSISSNCLVFSNDGKKTFYTAKFDWWLKQVYKTTDMHKLTLHGFRHTHASLLFAAGVSIKAAQKRLGHSKPEITMNVYTHISEDQVNDEIKKLDSYANF